MSKQSKDDVVPSNDAGLVVKAIREFAAKHGFVGTFTVIQRRQLASGVKVTTPFMRAVASGAETYGSLVGGNLDAAALRNDAEFIEEFTPVAIEAEALARAIRDQILSRLSGGSVIANAAYTSMKAIARTPGGVALAPRVAEMKKLRSLKKKSAAASQAPAQPAAPVSDTPKSV